MDRVNPLDKHFQSLVFSDSERNLEQVRFCFIDMNINEISNKNIFFQVNLMLK